MEVAVGICRGIVVDNDIHSLNINTTTEDVSGNKNTLLECLESTVSVDSEMRAISHQTCMDIF